MSNLLKRLDAHFVGTAAVAGVALMGAAQQSEAAIVYSGVVNLEITSSTNGLYLNVVTGATNQPGSTAGSTVAGWDINPWSSSGLGFFVPTGGGYVQSAVNTVANLAPSTLIDAASTFGSGGTTNIAQWNLNSSNNLFGFKFLGEDALTHYGWGRISLSASIASQPRALVEYAYEDVPDRGIEAGAIPAPGAAGLLALGSIGFLGRRRK